MRFCDLAIGKHFRFWFDWVGGWEYIKTGERRIKCVHTFSTEKECIGKDYPVDLAYDARVVILPQ